MTTCRASTSSYSRDPEPVFRSLAPSVVGGVNDIPPAAIHSCLRGRIVWKLSRNIAHSGRDVKSPNGGMPRGTSRLRTPETRTPTRFPGGARVDYQLTRGGVLRRNRTASGDPCVREHMDGSRRAILASREFRLRDTRCAPQVGASRHTSIGRFDMSRGAQPRPYGARSPSCDVSHSGGGRLR